MDYLKFNRDRSVTMTIENVYIPPKAMNILFGADMYKDKSNNWRRLHGLIMKRKFK